MANIKGIFNISEHRGIKIGAPGLQLTEATARPTDVRVKNGRLFYKRGVGLEVRHGGAWKTLGPLTGGEFDIPVPVIFETAKTGLDATTTGVKFTSQSIIPDIPISKVAIEATWTSSAGVVVAIELYDTFESMLITSVSGNEGTNVKSDYVPFTSGSHLVVRVNVTTAGGAGAVVDCTKAVVYFRVKLL